MSSTPRGHDIIVVGASAGGVEALTRIVAGLPEALATAMFVVLHIPPDVPSALASILDRAGPLGAVQAKDGMPIETGQIYVAPPNRHLVLNQATVALRAGPRENSARPSVDVLFRSAARAFGPRVVGVVLSGMLRDGALGLAAIKTRGGVTIVQDPDEALFAGMPESALRTSPVDFRLRTADIPAHLVELSQHSLEQMPMTTDPESFGPTIYAADEPGAGERPKLPNFASGLTCPECSGSLWEVEDGDSFRFECRVGHAYSVDALIAEQGEAVEAAMRSAVNAELTERHAGTLLDLLRRLIADGEVG